MLREHSDRLRARATIRAVFVITDDQLDLLRRVLRAGGSFTATPPHELRCWSASRGCSNAAGWCAS
jgi:hypothetical protein